MFAHGDVKPAWVSFNEQTHECVLKMTGHVRFRALREEVRSVWLSLTFDQLMGCCSACFHSLQTWEACKSRSLRGRKLRKEEIHSNGRPHTVFMVAVLPRNEASGLLRSSDRCRNAMASL